MSDWERGIQYPSPEEQPRLPDVTPVELGTARGITTDPPIQGLPREAKMGVYVEGLGNGMHIAHIVEAIIPPGRVHPFNELSVCGHCEGEGCDVCTPGHVTELGSVRIFRMNDRVYALVGKDLMQGIYGYGTNPFEALVRLSVAIDKQGWPTYK
jgi:hypothetical protein